ncbi:hypothetical protein ACFX1Z_018744 [Malus domestica]
MACCSTPPTLWDAIEKQIALVVGEYRTSKTFIVKSAYEIVRVALLPPSLSTSSSTQDGNPYCQLWKKLWRVKIPPEVQLCGWWVVNDLHPIKANLA